MRVLFTAVPVYGHLLPLLPLAEAAATAGDETAVRFVDFAPMAQLLATGVTTVVVVRHSECRCTGRCGCRCGEAGTPRRWCSGGAFVGAVSPFVGKVPGF
ncbi:hypothetical protein [Dactylosporangium sp. CA-139066]|uniref:hypothetical protein n=1 Tax=Dactylosporangium sp. CA-139066 TaxID=3239930 RepID=UPI003D8E834D